MKFFLDVHHWILLHTPISYHADRVDSDQILLWFHSFLSNETSINLGRIPYLYDLNCGHTLGIHAHVIYRDFKTVKIGKFQ